MSDITTPDVTPSVNENDKPNAAVYRGQNRAPQQASCKSTGICIAVIIAAMLAMVMLIAGIWLYVQKPTQAVVDTAYIPGQPAVDTNYTIGQPAVVTNYTIGQPAVVTNYTIGQPAVDTAYTMGQPAVDTTYTPGGTTNMSAHSTILPPGTTGPEREVSTNGVPAPVSTVQKGPVAPKKKWRDDSRCGSRYPAENGKPAECDPEGVIPCCSTGHWCGKTAGHCNCRGCVNYRKNKGTGWFWTG
ncbi:uncharacterized protein LOC144906364 [Branchiostoma floridae x Branchiostoma belcheri]